MGRRKYNLRLSIKSQIIVAVILILICSFLATMLTYIATAMSIHPTNTPEKSATALENYVSKTGEGVLSPSRRVQMDKIVQGAGVDYVVLNAQAKSLYGTASQNTITSRAMLIHHLNVEAVDSQAFVFGTVMSKEVPIIAKNGALLGAVYIRWNLFPGGIHGAGWLTKLLTIAFLIVPFAYMLLFTYIFARRVGRKLNRPLQALVDATRRIQERDLDFHIEYRGKNEIGKLLAAFEDMRKDLKQSLLSQWSLEEERREMLAAISHDLRTPMTIIQGHAELLVESERTDIIRMRRYLQTILRNSERVIRLMNDFRTVTDIDSQGFSLKGQLVNLEEFFTGKYNEFLVMSADAGIHMSFRLSDVRERKSLFSLDSDRISQVLDNVMANAIRFTPTEGTIVWDVVVDDERITVSIQDSGRGFSSQEDERIFQKFYQGDKSRSGEKGHSGLGLYIVKALVEKHRGTVYAENNEYGGATIRFCIRSID